MEQVGNAVNVQPKSAAAHQDATKISAIVTAGFILIWLGIIRSCVVRCVLGGGGIKV